MSAAGGSSPGNRPKVSTTVLAFLVVTGAMVALLLVAIIGWTLLQDRISGMSENQVPSPATVANNQTSGAAGAGGDSTSDKGGAPFAMAGTAIPQSAVQEISLAPKNIIANLGPPRARWTATPLPTSTPAPTPTPRPTFVSELSESSLLNPLGLAPAEKWIDVNLTSQTLVAYEGGLPVFDSLVSTGKSQYPTVTGQFRIWLRFQSQDMNGYRLGYDYYLRNVPYVQYFYQDYALHGTFWHSNFGTPMSHGCVNLPTPAAEWLFNWSEYGTLVNVHS